MVDSKQSSPAESGLAAGTEEPALPGGAPRKKKRKRHRWLKRLIAVVLAAAVLGGGALWFFGGQRRAAPVEESVNTVQVSRQTLQTSLSSSGTLQPLNTYAITSLVSGEVVSADFEEGDLVEEGAVLYRIDTDSVESQISSALTQEERAQEAYEEALADYQEAAADYNSLEYSSPLSGYIRTLSLSEGDSFQTGTPIAEIYDSSVMTVQITFRSGIADQITVGQEAAVIVNETLDQLTGTVTGVSDMEQSGGSGTVVRTVTIEVQNPGGLSEDYTASAQINGELSTGDGAFAAKVNKTITADYGGEIGALLVEEGDYVNAGDSLFTITQDSAEEQLQSLQDALENAERSLEDAQESLESQQDALANYEITAPISGQVVQKNVQAGENLNNSGSSSTLATIYDMSALTFEMSVDEMDVLSVEAGQEVVITADALEGQTFTGVVTNVSLVSSYSNGVTVYPVTVQIDETGDLLPGMNVTASIILEESEDALVVPASALQRGDLVYVKDDSASASEDGAPEGFRAVEVETGLINEDYVEILSGLEEGDEVYVSAEASSGASGEMAMGGMGGMGGSFGGMPGGSGGGMPGGGMPGGGGGMPGGMPGGGF